jgi:fucose permease
MTASRTTILIGYLAFGIFGIYEGLLGVVWPAMSKTFSVSLDSLGVLFMVGLVGFVLTSFSSGSLIRMRSQHWLLLSGTIVRTVGFIALALSPIWLGVVAGAFLVSTGGGAIDTSMNGFMAKNGSARQLNWLHASFGVGATAGPFLAATIIALGGDWRWSFGVVAIVQALTALLIALTAPAWRTQGHVAAQNIARHAESSLSSTLRLRVVWLSILLFFIYTGTELSASQWSFTLFALGRGVPELVASYWVGIFWATFTIGRIVFGFISNKWPETRMLRISFLAVVIGAALLWWSPMPWLGFAGLALMGLALAPIFPTLIAGTLGRVGSLHAANSIGFQIAAAGLGGSILTSVVGVLAESNGLELIGASVFVLSVLLLANYELMNLFVKEKTETVI